MSKKSLQPVAILLHYPRKVGGRKISNISYRDSVAETVLIYGGSFAKVLQYISKGGRVLPIVVGNYKNEGYKGKAKAAVALLCEYVTYPIWNKNGSRKA